MLLYHLGVLVALAPGAPALRQMLPRGSDSAESRESGGARGQRLPMPKQVAWLHFRKCGTSFINTLVHHKDLCPNWPDDVVMEMAEDKDEYRFYNENRLDALCPEGFSRTYESPPGCAGIGDAFDQNEGRVMGFFRQPEQRLVSDWYQDGVEKAVPRPLDAYYINETAGCAVKSLTRQGAFRHNVPAWAGPMDQFALEPCTTLPVPTEDEVKSAVERVKRMAFVGLTEEWALSICLFHAMYGGRCVDYELMNTRPNSKKRSGTNYSTEELKGRLKGWTDPWDGPVYEAAREIFWRRVAEYGVEKTACVEQCLQDY